MSTCNRCGGAVLQGNINYMYAGPVCQCNQQANWPRYQLPVQQNQLQQYNFASTLDNILHSLLRIEEFLTQLDLVKNRPDDEL